jgi:hypothetical protein
MAEHMQIRYDPSQWQPKVVDLVFIFAEWFPYSMWLLPLHSVKFRKMKLLL